MKAFVLASVVAASCVSVDAYADGPFGITMGLDASTLPGCSLARNGKPGMYVCKTVPKPHSDFESYLILSPNEFGACEVTAIGRDISDNGNGDNTKRKVDEIASQIATSYGQWTTNLDFLHAGAMFKDDGYWLMAVEKSERTYGYMWANGKFTAKNDVKNLIVTAKATKHDVGYVFVQFDFSNVDPCVESTKKAEGTVF